MAEEQREDFLFQGLLIFYEDFPVIGAPANDLGELAFLNKMCSYLQDGVELHDELCNAVLDIDDI